MIRQGAFPVEPWCLRETTLDLDLLAQSESLFALSNGHIGLRGNLDEGEPHALPGTYLNSVYELRPLPYAEAGYGYPESGQTLINVTNGKLIRLLADDEPFDVRYGEVRAHERRLDLRAGVLERDVDWVTPTHRRIGIRSARLVSLTQRATAAIHYTVRALDDQPLRVVLQSELVANEQLPEVSGDPRVAATLEAPLRAEHQAQHALSGVLVHSVQRSGLRCAAGMDHEVSGAQDCSTHTDVFGDLARVTVTAVLAPGETLELVKYLGYGWSATRSVPALRDQVAAAITGARHTGWQGLLDEQRHFLDEFWDHADVEVDGDAELQQAVRFALFHLMQAGMRAERRPVPAKGLTGNGYDGHCFWDTETFVLPVLTYTAPHAAADELHWRSSTIDQARARAQQLGLRGAAFPWRTIHGEECSAYWPAGTAAFHINADIADAVLRYVCATGDEEFERSSGLLLLVETARLWRSLGHHDSAGRFRIDGVTGPDEYSAVADNNVYTNLMAQRNLYGAAAAAAKHPDEARQLGVDVEEMASWRDAAEDMLIPFDEHVGVHPQSEEFTEHAVWDFAQTPPEHYPLLLHYPYFDLYRKQVVKQADLVLAMHLRSDAFTPEQKRRNFDYYEALTVRDSSLSACTQAVLAAEVGHLDLALDYTAEAALVDLRDLNHNTRDGLHMASLAGTWIALVAGFGGMRDCPGLSFAPRLPGGLTRLRFNLLFRGHRLRVEVRPDAATYTLTTDNGSLTLTHHGESFELSDDRPVRLPIPALAPQPRPQQPAGREPARRGSRPGGPEHSRPPS
ncbi:MAG TPA: glycoside hydrolase family 65 protein [Mycobacteriales bacterium]|nr:glycoside hydrolase family 65 protein [Mycobacteriales bacterium]